MDIFGGVLTRSDLRTEAACRTLVGSLVNSPSLSPDVWGVEEPVRRKFSAASIDEILHHWPAVTMWRKTGKPRIGGSVNPGRSDAHGSIQFAVRGSSIDYSATALDLLRAWSGSLDGDFGYLHTLTPSEIKRGSVRDVVISLVRGGRMPELVISTRKLRRGIPDLYWVTIFGPSYRELFSDKRLLSSPCHNVQVIGQSVFLQLTPRLEDVVLEPVRFESARNAVLAHLGQGFFLHGEGEDEQREAPLFRL